MRAALSHTPVTRLNMRRRAFLRRYLAGEDPLLVVAELWPKTKDSHWHLRKLMNCGLFQEALNYATSAQLSPHTLAYQALRLADDPEARPIDKINAIRAASQIMAYTRNGSGESSTRKVKTQKTKLKPLEKDELAVRLEELAEKAGQYGHSTKTAN